MVNSLNDMANLAIKGHATRCKEVIEILEMLGGVNTYKINHTEKNLLYFLREGDNVIIATYPNSSLTNVFTLEEFLEKYPYKIGDKVIYNYDKKTYFIRKMYWEKDNILYQLSDETYTDDSSMPDVLIFDVDIAKLQPYKEETMEEKGILTIDFTKDTRIADEVEVILGDYEFVLKDGKTYFVKKKPKYPKTYEECCKVLQMPKDESYIDIDAPLSYNKVLTSFTQLLICRDAYWKFADDFHPDWQDSNFKYCIKSMGADVIKGSEATICCILAFPTEEMRDAFYENFKELINETKELL